MNEAPGGAPAVEGATIGATIRYFAAARAAAGVPEERLVLPSPSSGQGISNDASLLGEDIPGAASTVGELLDVVVERHGPGLGRVLLRCSFLLDEVAVHGRQTPVLDGQVLDILPPFAGG